MPKMRKMASVAQLRKIMESEALREAYEERAAIMEYDGGLRRKDAEREALAIVWRQRQIIGG